MDNKLQNIKNIYERRNSSNVNVLKKEQSKNEDPDNEDLQINMKKRKSYVHDIVKIYEEKVRECI